MISHRHSGLGIQERGKICVVEIRQGAKVYEQFSGIKRLGFRAALRHRVIDRPRANILEEEMKQPSPFRRPLPEMLARKGNTREEKKRYAKPRETNSKL